MIDSRYQTFFIFIIVQLKYYIQYTHTKLNTSPVTTASPGTSSSVRFFTQVTSFAAKRPCRHCKTTNSVCKSFRIFVSGPEFYLCRAKVCVTGKSNRDISQCLVNNHRDTQNDRVNLN